MAPPMLREELPAVRLENQWTTTALRHPSLRLLGCFAHAIATFFLCSSSPLNGSVLTPAHFPIYSHWLAVTLSRISWEKVLFHVLLNVVVLLLLRVVAYRELMQSEWNWKRRYSRAKRAFSRLSSGEMRESSSLQERSNDVEDAMPSRVVELHTRASDMTALHAATRVAILADAASQGSWTFMALCYPFAWAAIVWFMETLLKDTALSDTLFGSNVSTVIQMRAQVALYQVLMTLSLVKLLVTLDLLLQDVHYCRAMFGNWLVRVRKAYITYPALRLLSCWLLLTALVVSGVYFHALHALQHQWIAFNLNANYANWTQHWFSNESWNALLSSFVVALDVLWLIQDFGFPGFPTAVGIKMFGLPMEAIRIRVTTFTSKWAACFVVLGVLLPLELCHCFQIFTYTPEKYGQYTDDVSHRVFPLLASSSRDALPSDLTDLEMKLLQQGSISRYFEWSAWERAPALGVITLVIGLGVWLWREERFTMRFSVFLGTQQQQLDDDAGDRAIQNLNTRLSAATKGTISKQSRLRELYALRSRIDNFCITLATLSVVSVVLQFRSIWRSQSLAQDQGGTAETKTDTPTFLPLQFPGEAYGVLLLLLSLALVYQLYQRYVVKMQLMVLRNELPPDSDKALRSSPRELLLPFLIELLVCGFCLPPFVHSSISMQETRYSLPRSSLGSTTAAKVLSSCPARLTLSNGTMPGDQHHHPTCDLRYVYPLEIVNMAVLVRLYWFVRIIRNQLMKKVVNAEHLLILSGVLQQVPMHSLRWSFRVAFKLAPGKILLSLFVFFWAGTAAAVSIFERPFPSLLDNEEHSLWMTIVTISSVGYGDAYPMTAYGRVSTFLGAVVGGAILVSLMTSVFLEAVKGSKEEHKVLGTMERVQWQKRMWHASAVLIASSWKRYQLRKLSTGDTNGDPDAETTSKNNQASKKLLLRMDRRLFGVAHQFKLLRKQKPKETYDSIKALKIGAIVHWRTNELTKWIAEIHEETHSSLDDLEHQLDAIESSLQKVLA